MKLQEYSKVRIQDWHGRKGKNVYSIIKGHINDLIYLLDRNKKVEGYSHLKLRIYMFKHYFKNPVAGGEFRFEIENKIVNKIICDLSPLSEFRSYGSKDSDRELELRADARIEFAQQAKHALEMAQKVYNLPNYEIRNE